MILSVLHQAPDLPSGVFAYRFVTAFFIGAVSTLTAQDARDAFATPEAIGLVADGFLVEGSYEGASLEAGESQLYPVGRRGSSGFSQSIWFTFSVPSNGVWKIEVGYPADWAPVAVSYPVVFEAASIAAAQPLFPLENNPRAGKCLLQAGKTYHLGLRTLPLERSYYEVKFTRLPAPANDSIANATVILSNSVVINPTGATLESGETAQVEGLLGSAWARWTAPSTGVWLLQNPLDRVGIVLWSTPTPLFPSPVQASTDSSWTPYSGLPGTRSFALFSSASVNAPATVLNQGTSWILFEAVAGQKYWIAGYDRWQSDASIALNFELAAPNDLRENARNLGSASAIRDEGHFLGASITPGEDLPNDFIVSRTVWRSWTARASGPVDLLVEGQGGPAASWVAVQAFSAGGKIGNALPDTWGREWRFEAVAGETYQFQISATEDPNTGFLFHLLAGEPADHFAEAVDLNGQALLSAVGCTLEPGEPAANPGEGSVWLRWHSGMRQVVSIIQQSMQAPGHWHDHKSRMEVFTGATLDTLVPACEQTSPGSALFVAEAGQTYHIRVLAKAEFDGEAQVTVTSQATGPGLEQLLAEAGALLATPGAGRDEQALALVNQALAVAPADPRAHLAAAFLELRLAATTPSGRIVASRLVANSSDSLPVVFVTSAAAGADGEIPNGLSFEDFLADFDAEAWPHLSTALQRLISITEPAADFSHYTLPVYPRGHGSAAGYETDAHDRRTIAAMIMTLRGALDYLASLDGSLPASDLFGWLCDGSPTLQELLGRYPKFLTFGPNDNRFSAWLWFTAATEQTQMAKGLYQAPWPWSDSSLFTSKDQPRLDHWFAWVESANGPTLYNWEDHADLSSWLFGSKSPRSLLPTVVGNRLRAYSTADVTFDGLLPDSTTAILHRAWATRGWLANHEELGAWLARNFPVNTPDPSEDPDGDGISLLLEYAFGLSPTNPDPAPYQPELRRVKLPDGTWRSELYFRRRIALTQSDYWAYKSTDLETWESVPVPEEAVPDAMPGFERVTVAVPDGPSPPDRAFFRLRFVPPSDLSGDIGGVIGSQ
jgi:hypothetical protein